MSFSVFHFFDSILPFICIQDRNVGQYPSISIIQFIREQTRISIERANAMNPKERPLLLSPQFSSPATTVHQMDSYVYQRQLASSMNPENYKHPFLQSLIQSLQFGPRIEEYKLNLCNGQRIPVRRFVSKFSAITKATEIFITRDENSLFR